MIPEKMLELLILKDILQGYDSNSEYKEFIDQNYNANKIEERYNELGLEFLEQYEKVNEEIPNQFIYSYRKSQY